MGCVLKILRSSRYPFGGLYALLSQPKQEIIEPNKITEPGLSTLNLGMFTGKLSQRMKSYFRSKYWYYNDGPSAFEVSVTRSYLIIDAGKAPGRL